MRARSTPFVMSAALVAALAASPAARGEVTLKETGSTLILPLFKVWAETYPKTHSGVTVTTDGTGSQKGIEAAVDGSAQIGTSDAFMSSEQAEKHPDVLNIAVAISAQTVNYNVPGLAQPLKIDGPTLVSIYLGHIRSWDDAAIAAINPGANLPHHDIVPLHRADGSGDTFVFTQYLSFTTQSEAATGFFSGKSAWDSKAGYGLTVNWPDVPGAKAVTGNAGMVEALGATPYAIGYVGVSYADKIAQAKLGTALVKNQQGEYLLPNEGSITAAAAALTPRTPDDERLSLVNAPGPNCYPLINYEYAMVSKKQPDAATAAALRTFLLWASAPDEANAKTLANEHFIPVPAHVWVKSHDQIEAIR